MGGKDGAADTEQQQHTQAHGATSDSTDSAPRFAQPDVSQQQEQVPEQRPHQQDAPTQPSWQQRHHHPRSNVVEIDDVEVSPIDDPFYDPNEPLSSRVSSGQQASSAAAAAARLEADSPGPSASTHPPTNAVAIDEVDFEGFTAPLLDVAEAGEQAARLHGGLQSAVP